MLTKFQNDTVVYPKESEWFGSYDVGNTEITLMEDSIVYKEDTIGLKTLDEQNKLYLREVADADHCHFGHRTILNSFIPFLFEKNVATNNP